QLIRSWTAIAGEFPDWTVKIFGVGPQLKELKDAIRQLGMGGKINLAGHRSDLSEEYAKASIFCHPAHFEGFGLSPAEALFLETPVVFYKDCPGVNEFVKDGFNGLAVERSDVSDGLADGLRKLITDAHLRRTLGGNGPQSVSHFTFDKYVSSWVDLIESTGA
ncbi:MAG: glycosyltransferase, partial [Proteobacteria bacterium]